MTVLDVIFPKKIPFVQVAVPFFWSQSGELLPQNNQKKKPPPERDTKKIRGKKRDSGEDGGTYLLNN